MQEDEAAAKAEKRAALMQRLQEEANERAKQGASVEHVNVTDAQQPAAKRLRVEVGPKCLCGLDSVRAEVQREGPHFGRPFFRCPRMENEQGCTLFVWEELLQDSVDASASGRCKLM